MIQAAKICLLQCCTVGFPVQKVRNEWNQSNRIKMSHILKWKSLSSQDLFYYGKRNNKAEEFWISSRIGKLSWGSKRAVTDDVNKEN